METFQPIAVLLLREAFEGREEGNNYTWFVEGKEGIFDALDSVDALAASKKPTPDCPSIAAHAYHMLFALRGGNAGHGHPAPQGTWNDSWKKQEATPEEWAELKENIAAEYREFLTWLEANTDWSDVELRTGALAMLPHMAYHLGAIRQILKVI